MHTIIPDIQVTRRQRLTHIADDEGELVWSGSKIEDALQYLVARDELHCVLQGEEHAFELLIKRFPD